MHKHILLEPVSFPSILPAIPLTDTTSVFWTPVPLISPPESLAPCQAGCWTCRCSSLRQRPPSRLRTPSHPRQLRERPGARLSPPPPGWCDPSLGGPCWSLLAVSRRAGPPLLRVLRGRGCRRWKGESNYSGVIINFKKNRNAESGCVGFDRWPLLYTAAEHGSTRSRLDNRTNCTHEPPDQLAVSYVKLRTPGRKWENLSSK